MPRMLRSLFAFCVFATSIIVPPVVEVRLAASEVGAVETKAAGAGSAAVSRPNIVFVFTDDLGWGDLGVFHQNDSPHDQTHRTPMLDTLARGGLQMRSHYCPAPVCAPSRSSLLTGVHQGNAVVRDNQFDKELEDNHTLGTVLQAAGYRTCMIGKYGLQGGPRAKQQDGTPSDWPAYPTRRGFDEFFGYVSHYAGHLHYPNDPWVLANKGHSGVPNFWASDSSGDHEISEALSTCYTTDLFTARAKHFLAQHASASGDQPFFLMLNYDTPHAALQVPAAAYPAGRGIHGGLQWTGGDDLATVSQPAINTATGQVDSFFHPDYADRDWPELDRRFATMVRRIDSAVGDLNQTLVDLGLAENTLVIFTSDNGPHCEAYNDSKKLPGNYTADAFQSYGPYDGIKRDCWEGGIRMPTLAWWRGTITPGRVDTTPSQFHDWMATFCDLAEVGTPARCDGVSLAPLLTGRGEQPDSTVYIEYVNNSRTPDYDDFGEEKRKQRRRQMQVIRMTADDGVSYKGVRYRIESAETDFEIYDVQADPSEATNLAGTSAMFDELQSAMKKRVLRLRSRNTSAPRPYDDAPVPALANASEIETRVRSAALSTRTDYVAALRSDAAELDAAAIDKAVIRTDRRGSFTAPSAGRFQVQTSVRVDATGRCVLRVDSTAAGCFARLHQAHAVDMHDAGVAQSSPRVLAAGVHPVTFWVRATDANQRVEWSVK